MINLVVEIATQRVLCAGEAEHAQERRIAHRSDAIGVHAIDAIGRGIEHKAKIGFLLA